VLVLLRILVKLSDVVIQQDVLAVVPRQP